MNIWIELFKFLDAVYDNNELVSVGCLLLPSYVSTARSTSFTCLCENTPPDSVAAADTDIPELLATRCV